MKTGVKLAIAAVAFWYIFMALALVLFTTPTTAAMANTVMRLVPSKAVVQPGEEFTLEVRLEPAAGHQVSGAQFDLSFNKISVEVLSVQEGGFLKQAGANTYFNLGNISNDQGKLTMVFGAILRTDGKPLFVTSAGVFAVIKCRAVNASTTSAFTVQNAIVASNEAVALPLELKASQVVVASSVDINLDGVVDAADLGMMVSTFGQTGAPVGQHRHGGGSRGFIASGRGDGSAGLDQGGR